MVKKLLKHEFVYYARTFALFLPIVLIIGLMRKLTDLTEADFIRDLTNGISTLIFILSCAALISLSFIGGVVRFYKNMYSAEGYLTFTLPVTNAQHIFVKLFTAVTFMAVCSVTVAIAVAIAVPAENLRTFLCELGEQFSTAVSDVGVANTVAYIAEVIIIAILYAAYSMLVAYGCITVGQTAKKHRILKAIGAYYVYHLILQVAGRVLTIIFSYIDDSFLRDIFSDMSLVEFGLIAVHMIFITIILILAVLCTVLWLITQRIMTKKLNLE
ncbi:MAG: hypothetical protein IIV03_01985 [Clostridia bacterium]|nr:hypothetical protein [Clostridia bacterium]MBQ5808616.1 hypothetical protein [Clostridia bacterium]MBR0326910.1 hypothetical protein [Clostridia bacterium]